MSQLRSLLQEITAARGAISLDEIASRIGVGRDEAEAMVGYWVRKGRLTVDDLSAACPSSGCGGCSFSTKNAGGCAGPQGGPRLLAISVPPRTGDGRGAR